MNHIKDIAEQIIRNKCLPKDLQANEMASLVLFMLVSRTSANIDPKELAYIEDSGDLSDFRGFFRDQKVKEIFVNN